MIRGMYFYSQKCKTCGKVICGESEQSRKKASKDYYRKMKAHWEREHSHADTRRKARSAV